MPANSTALAKVHDLFEQKYFPTVSMAQTRTAVFRPLPAQPTAWLRHTFPTYFQNSQGRAIPFAAHHEEFWAWVWALRAGVVAPSFIAVWSRGGGKSVSAELACAVMGYFGLRRYGLYICDTQSQADDHVQNVASMLELLGVERGVNKYGLSRGWRINRLRTAEGFTLDAIGMDVAMRGVRLDESRPDILVCHAKGTEVSVSRQWMKVEAHPTALSYQGDGLSIKLAGLPFAEIVTAEHRYWARKAVRPPRHRVSDRSWWGIENSGAGWYEAQTLTVRDYLGYPIDMEVKGFEPLLRYAPGGGPRNAQGQMTAPLNRFMEGIPAEFSDREWWWLFGLWWGDGHTEGRHVIGLSINAKQVDILDKVTGLLERWDIRYWIVPKSGCVQLFFTHTVFTQWLKQWRVGNSRKAPPLWVEHIDFCYQEELVKGYIAADGFVDTAHECVRVTSIHLPGLLSLRRILMRLGIASTIRHGKEAHLERFFSRETVSVAQKKYDLRFRQGAWKLGYPINDQKRYAPTHLPVFIEHGFVWSKIRTITAIADQEFIPITTTDHTYVTHYGLSHNCDDLDDQHDTPAIIAKKVSTLTRKILPAGSSSMTVLGVQNLPNADGIFAQLADGRAEFLLDRIVSGPYPALEGLPESGWWQREEAEDGTVQLRITAGHPTWAGQDIVACEALLTKIGIASFLVEAQHQTDRLQGALFQRSWFRVVHDWPRGARRVRFWDLAGTEVKPGNADPDWTAGALVAEYRGQYTLCDMKRDRTTPKGVEDLLSQTAALDGRDVEIWIEQEPGSSGKISVDHYQREVLKGYTVKAVRSTGSKVDRAKPASSAAEAGNFMLLAGPWNEDFLFEVERFPGVGKHDDQVDAISGAVTVLMPAYKPAPAVSPGVLRKGGA